MVDLETKGIKFWLGRVFMLPILIIGLCTVITACNGEKTPTCYDNCTITSDAAFTSDAAQNTSLITVTKSTNSPISLTGSVVIYADIYDSEGFIVPDGTIVNFSSDLAGTSIVARATTRDGRATSTFDANYVAGIAEVTVISGSTSVSTSIEILPASAGSITTKSISPNEIGIVNSGYPQNTIVTFSVTDVFGNIVADGTQVNFSLPANPIGGASISETSGTTLNGEVKVIVNSGTHAGLLSLNATVTSTGLTTTASIPIWGGKAVANNFNIYSRYFPIPLVDCTRAFTAVLGDIFGNPAAPGTPVTFYAENGTIAGTHVDTPESKIDASGVAFSTYTPLLADADNASKGVPDTTGVPGTGRKGWITILATAPGQEPFIDNNENGVYDPNNDEFIPSLHDYGEPFLDADEDGEWETGEKYFDTNGDGVYSGPNGVHDSDTVIWVSQVYAFPTVPPSISSYFKISPITPIIPAANESAAYEVTVEDDNGNPPSCGLTTYKTEVSNGCDVTRIKESSVPFGTLYTVVDPAKPTLPIYVPSYVTKVQTGKTCGDLTLTVESPNWVITQGGL